MKPGDVLTTLDNALRAAKNLLYKQPLIKYISCMNVNTVFTSEKWGSSFLDIAYLCHCLSTDSYLYLVDSCHDSKITLVTSDGSSVYLKASLINELSAV